MPSIQIVRDEEKDKDEKIKEAIAKLSTEHPEGSHPVGAFLDRLFGHDRPSLELGKEGFGSSVGATLGDFVRENALRLKSAESSPMSLMKAAPMEDISKIDKAMSDASIQGTMSLGQGANIGLGQRAMNSTTMAIYMDKFKNEKDVALDFIRRGVIADDKNNAIQAETPDQLRNFWLSRAAKNPGAFVPGDPDYERAVESAALNMEGYQRSLGNNPNPSFFDTMGGAMSRIGKALTGGNKPKPLSPMAQSFVDDAVAKGYSQEEALAFWEDQANEKL